MTICQILEVAAQHWTVVNSEASIHGYDSTLMPLKKPFKNQKKHDNPIFLPFCGQTMLFPNMSKSRRKD